MSTFDSIILNIAQNARKAARVAANLTSPQKNKVLEKMAEALLSQTDRIESENKKDLENAKKKNLSTAMIDRLTLNKKRIEEMAKGLREVAALPDPVGEVAKGWVRPNGLRHLIVTGKQFPRDMPGVS